MEFCTVVKKNKMTLTDIKKCPYIAKSKGKIATVMSKHLYETRKCL